MIFPFRVQIEERLCRRAVPAAASADDSDKIFSAGANLLKYGNFIRLTANDSVKWLLACRRPSMATANLGGGTFR